MASHEEIARDQSRNMFHAAAIETEDFSEDELHRFDMHTINGNELFSSIFNLHQEPEQRNFFYGFGYTTTNIPFLMYQFPPKDQYLFREQHEGPVGPKSNELHTEAVRQIVETFLTSNIEFDVSKAKWECKLDETYWPSRTKAALHIKHNFYQRIQFLLQSMVDMTEDDQSGYFGSKLFFSDFIYYSLPPTRPSLMVQKQKDNRGYIYHGLDSDFPSSLAPVLLSPSHPKRQNKKSVFQELASSTSNQLWSGDFSTIFSEKEIVELRNTVLPHFTFHRDGTSTRPEFQLEATPAEDSTRRMLENEVLKRAIAIRKDQKDQRRIRLEAYQQEHYLQNPDEADESGHVCPHTHPHPHPHPLEPSSSQKEVQEGAQDQQRSLSPSETDQQRTTTTKSGGEQRKDGSGSSTAKTKSDETAASSEILPSPLRSDGDDDDSAGQSKKQQKKQKQKQKAKQQKKSEGEEKDGVNEIKGASDQSGGDTSTTGRPSEQPTSSKKQQPPQPRGKKGEPTPQKQEATSKKEEQRTQDKKEVQSKKGEVGGGQQKKGDVGGGGGHQQKKEETVHQQKKSGGGEQKKEDLPQKKGGQQTQQPREEIVSAQDRSKKVPPEPKKGGSKDQKKEEVKKGEGATSSQQKKAPPQKTKETSKEIKEKEGKESVPPPRRYPVLTSKGIQSHTEPSLPSSPSSSSSTSSSLSTTTSTSSKQQQVSGNKKDQAQTRAQVKGGGQQSQTKNQSPSSNSPSTKKEKKKEGKQNLMNQPWAKGLALSDVQGLLRLTTKDYLNSIVDEVVDDLISKIAVRALQKEMKLHLEQEEEKKKKQREIDELAKAEADKNQKNQERKIRREARRVEAERMANEVIAEVVEEECLQILSYLSNPPTSPSPDIYSSVPHLSPSHFGIDQASRRIQAYPLDPSGRGLRNQSFNIEAAPFNPTTEQISLEYPPSLHGAAPPDVHRYPSPRSYLPHLTPLSPQIPGNSEILSPPPPLDLVSQEFIQEDNSGTRIPQFLHSQRQPSPEEMYKSNTMYHPGHPLPGLGIPDQRFAHSPISSTPSPPPGVGRHFDTMGIGEGGDEGGMYLQFGAGGISAKDAEALYQMQLSQNSTHLPPHYSQGMVPSTTTPPPLQSVTPLSPLSGHPSRTPPITTTNIRSGAPPSTSTFPSSINHSSSTTKSKYPIPPTATTATYRHPSSFSHTVPSPLQNVEYAPRSSSMGPGFHSSNYDPRLVHHSIQPPSASSSPSPSPSPVPMSSSPFPPGPGPHRQSQTHPASYSASPEPDSFHHRDHSLPPGFSPFTPTGDEQAYHTPQHGEDYHPSMERPTTTFYPEAHFSSSEGVSELGGFRSTSPLHHPYGLAATDNGMGGSSVDGGGVGSDRSHFPPPPFSGGPTTGYPPAHPPPPPQSRTDSIPSKGLFYNPYKYFSPASNPTRKPGPSKGNVFSTNPLLPHSTSSSSRESDPWGPPTPSIPSSLEGRRSPSGRGSGGATIRGGGGNLPHSGAPPGGPHRAMAPPPPSGPLHTHFLPPGPLGHKGAGSSATWGPPNPPSSRPDLGSGFEPIRGGPGGGIGRRGSSGGGGGVGMLPDTEDPLSVGWVDSLLENEHLDLSPWSEDFGSDQEDESPMPHTHRHVPTSHSSHLHPAVGGVGGIGGNLSGAGGHPSGRMYHQGHPGAGRGGGVVSGMFGGGERAGEGGGEIPSSFGHHPLPQQQPDPFGQHYYGGGGNEDDDFLRF